MAWNFILYLMNGLTFFTLGVAILSRDPRISELGIAVFVNSQINHLFHLETLEMQFN